MSEESPWLFATETRGIQGIPGADGAQGPQGIQGPPGPGTGAGAWQASTAYATSQVVQAPDGSHIKRIAAGTSRPTFDATERALWVAVLTSPGTVDSDGLKGAYIAGGTETSTKRVSAHPDGLLGALDGLAAFLTDPSGVGTVTVVGDSTMHDPGLAFDNKRAFYQHAQMLSTLYPGILMKYFRHDGALDGSMRFRPAIALNAPVGVGPVYWDNPGAVNYVPWLIVPRAKQGADIDWTAKIEPTSWDTGGLQHILHLCDDADGTPIVQFSFNSALMRLRWWSGPSTVADTATSSISLPTPSPGTPMFVRVKLDTDLSDTGAGTGWSCTFQYSTDNFNWTTLGTVQTSATPKPFRKVARGRLYLGSGNASSNFLVGKMYEAFIRSYIDGPVISPYPVTAWRSQSPTIYQAQVKGGPELHFWNGSFPGMNISDTFDEPNRFPFLIMPGNNLVHYINTNTNDAGLRGSLLRDQWAGMLAHHRAVIPGARIVAITGVPSVITSPVMPEKIGRTAQMVTWLPTQGVAVLDTWRAWLEDGRAYTSLNSGEHHPIDDGTLLDTNPVRRQARIITNAVLASAFAVQNPADMIRS